MESGVHISHKTNDFIWRWEMLMQRLQYGQRICGGNSLVEPERRDDSLSWGRILKKKMTSKVSEGERKELMLETVLIRFVNIKSYCYNFRKWMVELEYYIWWDFFSPHWSSFTSCNWKLTVQTLDFLPLYYKTSAACCKIETRKNVPPCKWANEKESKRPNRYYSKNVKTGQLI